MVDCGPLESPEGGMVLVNTTTFQSVANYSCNDGYSLIGESVRTCLNSSDWSHIEPYCTCEFMVLSSVGTCIIIMKNFSLPKIYNYAHLFLGDGVQYFVAFPINFLGSIQRLFVSTRESEPVPFTVETLRGFNFSGVVDSSTSVTIELPASFEVRSSSERDKGIRISSGDKQIAVYGLSSRQYSSGAFSALLCSRQNVSEYEYYGVTYEDGPRGFSELLFVACGDDTTVRFGSEVITLNQMETYLYTAESDLTGMRVVSDKPISFFSGHQCNFIPPGVFACGHILEQLPNTALWGKQFLSASLHGRSSTDIYSVVSYSPGTNVTFSCTGQSLVTLSEFADNHETVVVPNNAFCAIESNNPILVVQYASGRAADGITGDPFMMTLPSIEEYSNNFAIIVPSQFPSSVVALYVPPEYYQPERIFVNDSQINAGWSTIHCANQTVCGYSAYVSVGAGQHSVYHDYEYARIGVSVYGFEYSKGIGYLGVGAPKSVPLQGKYDNSDGRSRDTHFLQWVYCDFGT